MNKKQILQTAATLIDDGKSTKYQNTVIAYAREILAEVDRENMQIFANSIRQRDYFRAEEILLNGAGSWGEYSHGGCSLCYDAEICKRICTATEQRYFRGGAHHPLNATWQEVQAQALQVAAAWLIHAAELLIFKKLPLNEKLKQLTA